MTHYDTYNIHTCHDNCQRIACVLRRELAAMTEQRDRLAMALQELCEALLTAKPRDITELLNKAGDSLQFTTNQNEL